MRTVSAFLPFKGLTQPYLFKTTITYNKYLTPQLKEDDDAILAKPAAEISFLNLA